MKKKKTKAKRTVASAHARIDYLWAVVRAIWTYQLANNKHKATLIEELQRKLAKKKKAA